VVPRAPRGTRMCYLHSPFVNPRCRDSINNLQCESFAALLSQGARVGLGLGFASGTRTLLDCPSLSRVAVCGSNGSIMNHAAAAFHQH